MNALRDFVEFIEDCWPPLLLGGGLILLVLVGAYFGGKAEIAQRDEFMAECEQHRPKYECTAMWRAGEPDYVPVVVPIQTH